MNFNSEVRFSAARDSKSNLGKYNIVLSCLEFRDNYKTRKVNTNFTKFL